MWLLALLSAALLGCVQDVSDIDRTQPNKTKKSDLEGIWYMLQTVGDVPTTAAVDFIGDSSEMEKIVWEVQENYLLAYRSYPRLPGSDDMDGNYDYTDPKYHESPVAVYPILSHFDIQRQYDSSTGEQSNVLVENSSDRPWYDREYMRVDWSMNQITNFNLLTEWWWYTPIELGYAIDEESGSPRSIYTERNKVDELVYFDVPSRLLVEPDLWGCAYSWWGWGTEDCTSAEVEVVTAFAKTEARRDYEPLPYDDRMMNRFGYFRSERNTFDQQRGVLESGISKLAQRHNIWKANYQRDADGAFLKDAEGRMVPIPVNEREVATLPYYLSATFPEDALIVQAGLNTIIEWDNLFRETAAQTKGVALDQIPNVFVPCHNPVAAGDHEACGTPGFSPRMGDLRYNVLYWVNAEQNAGLLGYGPSAADPETGEIISARANVYAGALNTYASYGVDVIRMINGDLQPAELVHADHVRQMVADSAESTINLDKVSKTLRNTPLGSWKKQERGRLEMRELRKKELRPFDRAAASKKIEAAQDAGFSMQAVGEEFQRSVASRLGTTVDQMTKEQKRRFDPLRMLNPTQLNSQRRKQLAAMARGVCFTDMIDPNVTGLAKAYEGRTDYDQIWRELRAELFRSTAVHEVGHTLGLRHNFSGSYDSMNYFDEYWDARKTTLAKPTNMEDLYTLNVPSKEQLEARMPEYQYSSIMDYGLKFNTDIHGVGRYDRAAIMFGYSSGSTSKPISDDGTCSGPGMIVDPKASDRCLVRTPGYVEIYQKRKGDLGEAGTILTGTDEQGIPFDDAASLVIPYLERFHYTTVIQAFNTVQDAFDREWMRLDEFWTERAAGGDQSPVRVPYLFCTDEWVGAMLSCNMFDGGADPFEAVQNVATEYRSYYYFRDFKRDRLGWDPYNAFYSYYAYVFLTLSDYYQNWYLGPQGYDQVLDDYYWMAINTGFNIIVEALATPEYGTYCVQPNGQLFHLSDTPGAVREETSDYYLRTYCDADSDFVQVPQGEGRRRFTRYDLESGFNYGNYPQEAGHVWTSMAAMLALVDPEAFVIGAEGDIGTYSISFLDFFGEEAFTLVNAVMTEDYPVHSPVLQVVDRADGTQIEKLRYPVLSPIWDADRGTLIDPETGVAQTDRLGPSRARTGICEPCSESNQCNGYNGSYSTGSSFCVGLADDSRGCLIDCYEVPADVCPRGFFCDENSDFWCMPEAGTCADAINQPACSVNKPTGKCPTGQTCEAGVCTALWPIVESNTSLSQVDDLIFWGMLYSTFGWETRYNDQINVFKMGTAEEIKPGPGFKVVTFTDPVLGDEYGAVREDCDAATIAGGSAGLCDACQAPEDCSGYIGNYVGGVFCEPLTANGTTSYCLLDCTDGPCPSGYLCEDTYCIPNYSAPAAPSCNGLPVPCSSTALNGTCPDGQTCYAGACTAPSEPSPRCRAGWSPVPGGAQMVARGQALADDYQANLKAYLEDDGSDPIREENLYWQYSKTKYAVEWQMMELNTIRAVYAWLGKVY
ncbi:MAG: hypothetical protein CO108_24460 [Deltaproteobacteria bacterium CG_4_9_14_3_um_filter_63_12]|nr:MAG: hypothetical protein CO108_24460 [Deltaproteobacteria bacterium CG_4_9_14_3_um_filter_63_12]